MTVPYAFFILIFLGFSICFSGSTDAQDYNWVGFRFAQNWPAAYCSYQPTFCDASKLIPAITIHGLWPYKETGDSLTDCEGPPFDRRLVAGLREELNLEWPSSDRDTINEAFWEFEWDHHGTCSIDLLNQRQYFETALHFRKKFHILEALLTSGIYPNDQYYTVESVINAIKQNFEYTPTLHCVYGSEGELLLFEFFLCVNQLGNAFMDCPESSTPLCGNSTNEVKFISLASAVGSLQVNKEVAEETVGKDTRTAFPARYNSHTSSRAFADS